MHLSKHTFSTFSKDNERMYLINYLSGVMDVFNKTETLEFNERLKNSNWQDYEYSKTLLEKKYFFENQEAENKYIRQKYLEFLDENERTPTQLIFSTTYACNLSCVYCFQSDYKEKEPLLTENITNKFFNYIEEKFKRETLRPYITLFGGEPLLAGKKYFNQLIYFLQKARDLNYEIAIVTNGYTLEEYVPVFKKEKFKIKEIQVTLDGGKIIHDKRRPAKGGHSTFNKITAGIDTALKNGYRINLRSVIDKENIKSLIDLAGFCDKKGWLGYSSAFFETTLGRNYELHSCQYTNKLFDRLSMYKEYVNLAAHNPILKKFHQPSFHGMKYLYENDELPMPIFDACPAAKKEWAFDTKGNIYGCTASVGVENFKLGNFLDNEEYKEKIEIWQKRDVLSIENCKNCAVSLSCGAGCGVLAYKENNDILTNNCRPVQDLVTLGVEYYNIENLKIEKSEVCCC
ncbi:MAG: radical SAM protein [Spirochaetia bacterium]|nr:radical SAM protein [Spirochaetia bacterium]